MSPGGERAVSNVVGFVLVFGLVAAAVGVVSVHGFATLEGVRNAEQTENAERAFDVLADNMEDVYREGAPSRATEVSLKNAQLSASSSIRVNVSGTDGTTTTTVTNVSLQPIVWESTTDNTRVAYSLGAVVREEREGEVVVGDPPFVLREDRLILPVVRTATAKPASYGGTTVRVRGVYVESFDRTDGVDQESFTSVWINVTTPRADAWERYFDRTDVTEQCIRDSPGGDERVACELDATGEVYVSLHKISVEIEQ
jgi:hypothetical protein